jgi:HK97 family phage prohead protease
MQHLALKATTTATDTEQGTFTALVSAWEADREKDIIEPTAFDKTIRAWQGSGKRLPLLFEHSTEVVGSVDPHSMTPTAAGLEVAGEVDRSTEKGQAAWRSIKADSAGFSIGFMSESRPRKGGGRTLTEVDLLEVSITSTPTHPATRATSWKSAANSEYEDPATVERKRISDLSVEELQVHGDALLKSVGIDPRPAPEIKTFAVE